MQGLDGDVDYPTICGTGTEDYFGGAWCFGGGKDPTATQTYSTPFLGYPLYRNEPGEVPRHGLYRWHVMDPIHFKQDFKVTIQALGWWPNGTFEPLADDTVLDDSPCPLARTKGTGHCLGRLLVSGRTARAVP